MEVMVADVVVETPDATMLVLLRVRLRPGHLALGHRRREGKRHAA
jgi:hypothetical protein